LKFNIFFIVENISFCNGKTKQLIHRNISQTVKMAKLYLHEKSVTSC